MKPTKFKLPKEVEVLADSLASLPGIGPKNAQKLAIYLITRGQNSGKIITKNLDTALNNIRECSDCGNLATDELCEVCKDESRDSSVIMVVENVNDLVQIDGAGVFEGKYLVLGGLISPISGIGPDDLRIQKLFQLIRKRDIKEVILALSSSVEGEATSLYILELATENSPLLKITQLAKGLPTGVNPEYLDSQTLKGAIAGRNNLAK